MPGETRIPTWIDAASRDDVPDGGCVGLSLNGIPVVLARFGGDFFALRDLCTHGAARLSEGFVENGCIECPLHQGLFDLRTGEPRSAPVTRPVKTYPVRLSGTRVEIGL